MRLSLSATIRRLLRFTGGASALAAVMLIAAGCSSDPPKQEIGTAAPKAAKAAPTSPLRVRVIVPYSGNMPGFMGFRARMAQNTEFQARIGRLLNEVHSSPEVKEAEFFVLDDAGSAVKVPFDTLRGRINGVARRKYGPGLGVKQVFDAVLIQPNLDQTVTVLVTDLTDHSRSKLNLAALEDDVTSALAPLRRLGLRASVYADTSRYYGTYYPAYQQPPRGQEVAGGMLPYYVWVIGPAELVSHFNRALLASAPAQQAHFGAALTSMAYAARLQPAMKPQNALACTDGKTCHGVELNLANGPAEFAVGLDLTDLAPDLQQPEALNRLLQLDVINADAQLASNSVQALTATERNKPALAAYTHVVRIRVKNLFKPEATVTLHLSSPPVPGWVAAWSTADDIKPAARTFHLDWIINGTRKAYGEQTAPLFTCPIQLRKH